MLYRPKLEVVLKKCLVVADTVLANKSAERCA